MRTERRGWLALVLLALLAAGCGGAASGAGGAAARVRNDALGGRSVTSGRVPHPGLYRADTGWWYLLHDFGPSGPVADSQFVYGGDAGDLPVTGDWDADGLVEVGVYRRTTGRWYLLTEWNASGPVSDLKFSYGGDPSDLPLVGDFDGDGKDDPGLYRALTGTWYLLTGRAGEQVLSDLQVRFPGGADAIPVVGDFDGDDRSDLGLFNRSTGWWYLDVTRDGSADMSFLYGGAPGDMPVVGDFDGDGRDDPGIYRPSTGWWYLLTERTATSSVADLKFVYGGHPSDVPTVGDYDGDGRSDPGVYRRDDGIFFLLTERQGSQPVDDLKLRYGGHPSDLPLTPAPLLAPLRPYPGALPDSMLAQVTVEPATLDLPQGLSHQFLARGRYLDGSWRDVTERASWSANNSRVFVSNTAGSRGRATASTSSGSAVIEARLAGLSATATVNLKPPVILDVTLSPQDPTLALGITQTFTMTADPSAGHSYAYPPSSVTWTTSDPVVAPMVSPGVFQGMAVGTSTITASVDGWTRQAVLTVTEARVTSLTLTPERPLLPPDRDVDFRVVASYTDGLERDVTGTVEWTTSAPTVASLVGPPGRAHTLVPGSTTLTARDPGSGLAASTPLVVSPASQVLSLREAVSAMATSPDGSRLYVQFGGYLHAYDSTTLEEVDSWFFVGSPFVLSPDGRYAAAPYGSSPPRITVLDLQTRQSRLVPLSFPALQLVFGRPGRLYSVSSVQIGSSYESRAILVVDTQTWTEVAARSLGGNDRADHIGYSHAHDRVLVGSSSPYPGIYAYDASTDALAYAGSLFADSPSKHIFVTGDGQEVVNSFTSTSLAPIADFSQPGRPFSWARWYDLQGIAGRFYATLTREVRVIDAATLQETGRVPVTFNPLNPQVLTMIQVSGDGQAMAVAAEPEDWDSPSDPLFVLIRLP